MSVKENHPVKKIRINRRTWLVGVKYDSSLRDEESGQQCCLGFYAKACGYKNLQLVEVADTYELANIVKDGGAKLPKWARTIRHIKPLVKTNDDPGLPNEVREKKIAKLFANRGVQVEFYGRYPEE